MSILKDLESLSGKKFFQYIVLIGFLICPFYIFLFLFCRDIFIALNPFSLIILSVSLSFPIFAVNILFLTAVEFRLTEGITNFESTFAGCAWFSAIFLYVLILIGYFKGWKANQVISAICIIEFFLLLLTILLLSGKKIK